MASYDLPHTATYQYAGVNFATTTTGKIPVPRKCTKGRVLDIAVYATTTFTQTTTAGAVEVGDGTTATKFANLSTGGTVAGNSVTGNDQTSGPVYQSTYFAANYNSGAGLHDLIVTFLAPTGGTPAGVGNVFIIMAWDEIQSYP
jgi:hypothetical protein